jgi:hypothetical protein
MKKLLKKFLNSRVGHLIIIQCMIIYVERVIKTGMFKAENYDSYARLHSLLKENEQMLINGLPFVSLIDQEKIL